MTFPKAGLFQNMKEGVSSDDIRLGVPKNHGVSVAGSERTGVLREGREGFTPVANAIGNSDHLNEHGKQAKLGTLSRQG